MHCACGAERAAIEVSTASNELPSWIPGPLLEPCRCPACVTCGNALDDQGYCVTVGCLLYGTEILIPDVPTNDDLNQEENDNGR